MIFKSNEILPFLFHCVGLSAATVTVAEPVYSQRSRSNWLSQPPTTFPLRSSSAAALVLAYAGFLKIHIIAYIFAAT